MRIIKDTIDTAHCYAIRRVNPFLGVLQVIETIDGRAISTNGVVWDIEVIAECGHIRNCFEQDNKQVAFYRYGLWSLEDGLVSRPLSPHLEADPLTHQCNNIIDSIKQSLNNLPFKLIDHEELWLFDKENKKPLVLLDSAISKAGRTTPDAKYWSSCLGAEGVPSQRKFPQAKQLEEQLAAAASFNIKTHWIKRQLDGSGIIENTDIQFDRNDFPVYLIIEDWHDAEQSKRAKDFIAWISPSLLTLQHLSDQARERLEDSLYIQAQSIEHHWHLYPRVLDEKKLNAARVQCQLQRANQ